MKVSDDRAWDGEYRRYQRHLLRKRPGTVFALGLAEFRALASGPCAYCGAAPSIKMHVGGGTRNGIDRLLSSGGGYTAANCATCCWTCNRLKSTFTPAAFLVAVRRIVAHLGRQ